MRIEYLPGIVPGKKINLSKFENKERFPSPETYLEKLKLKLGNISERLNAEYGDFLDDNAQIKMEGDDLELSETIIRGKENLWASDVGKTREEMLNSREKNPANIAEIAATLLFDKVLNKDFIIVRASTYDDYENGADQLIIDKQSGAVICGLDDAILGESLKDTGEKKALKIDKKMKKGGAQIKYGATVNQGVLERRSLNNVPIFYFNLAKNEMNKILSSLSSDNLEITSEEKKVYTKLINSLLDQSNKYQEDVDLNPRLKNNIHKFQPSLNKMKDYLGEFEAN